MIYPLEEVFRTEGVPAFTFVKPPNFGEILVDLRTPGKPVIIEGQSGTGKTTTVIKILEESLQDSGFEYLSARRSRDIPRIIQLSSGEITGKFIVDDFHRLNRAVQSKIANIIKIAAEEYGEATHPKVVIIGINKVGSELIHLVHDIAKRCGIHRIQPASKESTIELIRKGEEKLLVKFVNYDIIFNETRGDYWLTQLVCQVICIINNVDKTQTFSRSLEYSSTSIRTKVISKLEHSYQEAVKEFCRGNRFRSTNDPYFKLLKCVGEQDTSFVDLTELANANPEVRGSINNIKEYRLTTLIDSKPICDKHFYYNAETKSFAIEDPALFYYIKHLNWDEIRRICGFRNQPISYEFDFAISFAGENRDLARQINRQLESLDCSIFFDELYEANFLGTALHKKFNQIFSEQCRFVICLLDTFHLEKIWPTFERECFLPRISDGSVIPVYLDDTIFPGIPRDLLGINFNNYIEYGDSLQNKITDEITFKVISKLENL